MKQAVYLAFFTLFAFLFILPRMVLAEDKIIGEQKKYNSDEYSPEYCEFTATFPEEPYITKRCETDKEDSCYDLISFTKVFDVESTVKVEIICNPSSEEMYKNLTPDAMKTTVQAMAKNGVKTVFKTDVREEKDYRQAGLIGQGHTGMHDSIFIAQLWSGKQSMMSVQAELIGPEREDADQLFARILGSIKPVGDEEAQPENTEKPSPEKEDAAKKE